MVDFALSEQHEAVRGLATDLLGGRSTPERLSAVESDGWFDRDLWREIAETGLLGIALPEAAGGSGLDQLAVHLVLEQVGATVAHVPYLETVVLGALPIAEFGAPGLRDDLLPKVVAGDVILTAALHDIDGVDPAAPTATAQLDGDTWLLTGTKTTVPFLPLADLVVVSATTDADGPGLFLVDPAADGVTVRDHHVVGDGPHGELHLSGTPAVSRLGDAAALGWLLTRAWSAIASLVAGACDAALRLAADYTGQREQFGRPIATFQAVGQRVADAYIDTEGIRLTALQAAWRLSEGLPADDEVAIAKWWAADAGHRVIHAAHHVHGGVGVDKDYPLHRYLYLIKQLEFALGSGTQQLLRLGDRMAAEPA